MNVELNEKRDVYEAQLFSLGITRGCRSHRDGQAVREAAGGRHLGTGDPGVFFRGGAEGLLRSRCGSSNPSRCRTWTWTTCGKGASSFTAEQWLDVLLRSSGMEPTTCWTRRVKWHLLARMIPFVENNYNVCELGPRGTGKSHIYKEVSPNSILISGGQTTVANLFYNLARRQIGLVGVWDVVAFDEVAGIHFKDHDGVQIMKDFMASGSFVRGRAPSMPRHRWCLWATSTTSKRC